MRSKRVVFFLIAMFYCMVGLAFAAEQSSDVHYLNEIIQRLKQTGMVALSQYDVDVVFGGRIRHETFNFTSPLVFRSDYFDRYTFQRAKFNFDIDSSFGKRTYGEDAVNARFRITTFNVIDNYYVYTPPVIETVSFSSKNYIKKADIGDHSHHGIVTLAYIEEGFVDVKLDKFLPMSIPVSMRVGYFPYTIGRGLTLGDYYGGAVDILGWREKGDIGNTSQHQPGITLTLGDADSLALQGYYCKWRKLSQGPDYTRKENRARRLDRDEQLNDPRAIQRGHTADRDLFALRGMITHTTVDDGFSSYVEPYLVYVNSPELEVEFEGDASAKLGTVGCMVDWSHNGWNINVEAGVQFGHQVMHPIDRNHLVYDDAYYNQTATQYAGLPKTTQVSAASGNMNATIGTPAKYHSHIFLGANLDTTNLETGQYLPYRAYYTSDELQHVNASRAVGEQGALVRSAAPVHTGDTFTAGTIHQSKQLQTAADEYQFNDSLYSPYVFKSGIEYYDTIFGLANGNCVNGVFYNANIPFGGATRFRDKYTLAYRGVMAMVDVSYTLPSKKATLAIAAGHIGGDDDPFNDEQDKMYHGFVPLRDANYQGRSVNSYAVLAARKIARPSTYSNRLLYAQNHSESITNLQYLGLGMVLRPCDDRNELLIEGNLLYFWETQPPFMWDVNGVRDLGSANLNGIWKKLQEDLHFTGYQRDLRASRQLGLEFNMVVTWTPVPNIEIRGLFATFIPGKLYRDVDGTPNAFAIRSDADGDVHLESLGHKVPFGGMVRLTYYF